MMKKFRLVAASLLVVCLSVGAVTGIGAQTAVAGTVSEEIDGITYTVDSTAASAGATVASYSGAGGAVAIPASVSIGGVQYAVTDIGARAFNSKALTAVTIPDGVKRIGSNAFEDNQLASVSIPGSVTSIGEWAFAGNLDMATATIGNGVVSIGVAAFYYNGLTSITIPDSVTAVGTAAFFHNSLSSVLISSRVTEIKASTFAYNQLTSVTVPSSVRTIGQGAFRRNPLTSVLFTGAAPDISAVQVRSGEPWGSFGVPDSVTMYYQPAYESGFGTPWSGYTSVAASPFTTTSVPTILGTARVGQTLTARIGIWWIASPTPPTFDYVWTAVGSNTVLGIGETYVPTVDDVGKALVVRVTAAGGVGYISSVPSAASEVVQGGAFATLPTPSISGSKQVAQTLIADPGTWPEETTLTYAWRQVGSDNVVGMGSRYTISENDLGKSLVVTVTATRPGFTAATVTSSPTSVVTTGVFVTTTTPTISGLAKVGQPLTAHMNRWWTWLPTPTTVTYAWTRSGSAVVLGTDDTYVPTAADIGFRLIVTVTAARSGYVSAVVPSGQTAVIASAVFDTTPVPTLSGTSQVGQRLTVNPGTWPLGTTLSYAWRQVGSEGVLSTVDTYTPVSTDQGKTLTVTVTASLSGYADATVTSAPSAAVVVGVFGSAVAPTITGTAQVGQPLRVSTSDWASGATFTYSWKRAGNTSVIGTAATYTPVAADIGKNLTVTVTASRAGFTTATTPAAVTAAVLGLAFTTSPTPTITGATTTGSTLTAATGTWSQGASVTFKFVWNRATGSGGIAEPIKGATSKTYKLMAADKGKYLSVTVTASLAGYATTSRTSVAIQIAN